MSLCLERLQFLRQCLLLPEEPGMSRRDLGVRPWSAFQLLHCLCLVEWLWGTILWEAVQEFWPLLLDLPRVWLLVVCCCLEESLSCPWCLLLLLEGVSCWGLGACVLSAFQLLQRLWFVNWSRGTVPWKPAW